MKILISQQEQQLPPFFYLQDALEKGWYSVLAGHDILPVPNLPNQNFERFDFDCLIISGGKDSVNRHLTENQLYALAEQRGVPVIGFCHGAFAVNDLAGGVNGKIPGHVDHDHDVILDGQAITVNSYHSQNIQILAPGFESLAQAMDGSIEAFKHILKPVWGVVWHPERMKIPVLPRDLAKFLYTSQSPWTT
jgi:putative glutamine amidotransferase